jgi:flagellar biosynthesis/type III secretory pathway ATPase
METGFSLDKYRTCLDATCTIRASGSVTNIIGLVIEARGPVSRLGTVCDIYTKGEARKITAEVMGFRDNHVLMMPLEEIYSGGSRAFGPCDRRTRKSHR